MAKAPNSIDAHVGQRVRSRRQQLGLSQTDLARSVGLTFQQIQKYEKGANRMSSGRLQQFANLLDVDIPYFFDGAPGHKVAAPKNIEMKYLNDFTTSVEGKQLMKAFVRISDQHVRRNITRLIESLSK